jgi:hypothetical protein
MERAQALFHRKEVQAREGRVAMAEYEAAGRAEREKTVKLRALRLAKEEADARAAEKDAALAMIAAAAKPKTAAKPGIKAAAANTAAMARTKNRAAPRTARAAVKPKAATKKRK